MRIMSFNTQHCLNFVEKRIDFQLMADTIKGIGPDFVGLNEIRGEGPHPDYTPQTEKLSELLGMEHYYFAKALDLPEGIYGNALISKIPIVSAETILVPEHEGKKDVLYEQRCLLKARLENGYTVLVIHMGRSEPEAVMAVKTVVENLADEKCILMGDFNLTPDSPILLPIRERMRDTAELFTEEKLSFPSDKPDIKIDYIFVSKDIKPISADIPHIVASDHRPYIADIEAL